MPPVMAFHLGSLGFLTPFNFENFQTQVTQVIQGEWPCSRATAALGTRVSSLGLGLRHRAHFPVPTSEILRVHWLRPFS